MASTRKSARRDPEKERLRSENAELRRRLDEAEQHRHLLIQTLHTVSGRSPAALRSTAVLVGPTYDKAAIGVRKIIWDKVGPGAFRNPPIDNPEDIPSYYNLGVPAPIGMQPLVISSLLAPINRWINQLRSDNS